MGYIGDVEVMVTWNPATAAIGGTLTAVMSNLETADGDPLVFTVGGTDRAVRDVIFSGISVTANDDDNLEFTGASQSLGVEFVDRAQTAETTGNTAAINGIFVNQTEHGPLGVIGRWSVTDDQFTGEGAINGPGE